MTINIGKTRIGETRFCSMNSLTETLEEAVVLGITCFTRLAEFSKNYKFLRSF